MKSFDFDNDKYHMGHLFLDSMRNNPDAIYQIDAATEKSETNASVLHRSIQLARCMRCLGTQPGDILALGGKNHLDLDIPFHAAHLNGMPISGVDPLFKYTEIKSHFKVSSPRVAFCQREQFEDYSRVITDLQLETKLICFDDGEHSLRNFIEQYDNCSGDDEFIPLDFDLDKVYAWVVGTGGTTGVLKLAAIKHKTVLDKITMIQKMLAGNPEGKYTNYKIGLHFSPVQWISSYLNIIIFPVMHLTKVMTSAQPTPEHVIDIINKYKPVCVPLSPSLLTAILKSDKYCDFTCFDNILVGGSIFSADMNMELRKRFRPDATLTEVYGQTENMGPVLIPNRSGPLCNCGKADDNWQVVKLVDPDTGKELSEPFVKGEMWTKGAGFTEYYKNPEATAMVFTEDGWYKTGDLLYRDDDGNYYFVERLSMLIKCRNYQVIPVEVETVIRDHPAVQDVSVTSIPHEEDGEHPVACVVRKPGANVSAQEIKDIVAIKLSETQQLRGGVVFMNELPLTSTGKVARGKLRQMALDAHRE